MRASSLAYLDSDLGATQAPRGELPTDRRESLAERLSGSRQQRFCRFGSNLEQGRDLLALPGWQVDALVGDRGEVAAAAFSFADDSGYYLYNSAYEPELSHLSPGQVLLGALIEKAIDRRLKVFDFLKGDEAYKYRLGSAKRPLYEIVAVT